MLRRSPLPDCPRYFALPCALSGLVLLFLTVFGAQSLRLGSAAGRAVVGILLLLFALLTLALLWREGCPDMTLLLLILPIACAIWLRLICLEHQTYDYRDFLAGWVAFFRDNGGFSAIRRPVGNYNVPYLYFLAAISYVPVPDLYLIKLFSIGFDILLAWAGLRLAGRFCREGSPLPLVCFAALLFLPTVVLNGAYWGQCDSLYGALTLLALDAALRQRPKTSVVLLAVAFSFKLQTVFLIPLWCAFLFDRRIRLRHLLLFPTGYAATILPALALGKPLGDILGIYLDQAGYYSALSLNAASVFSFLPYGAQVNEALLSTLGILAAFALVLALLGVLFWRRKRLTPSLLLNAAVVMAIGVPFFLPHMHDRYFFLADALTLVWACSDKRRIPVAALVQVSSLSCYCTYLRLRYTLPIRLGGTHFVMAFEGLLMLSALVWSAVALVRKQKKQT